MPEYRYVIVNNQINENPHLEGTKLTVFDIVLDCKHEGIDSFLNSLSEKISIYDLKNVFKYCKTRQCDNDGSHCGGCSLRPLQDGINNEKEFVNRFAEVRFVDSDEVLRGGGEGVMIMPGTPSELSQNWRGVDGWLIAAELLEKIK